MPANVLALGAVEYQVVYNGVFSAGTDLAIADLRLEARDRPGPSDMAETQIEVTSAAYPVVERLFRIRLKGAADADLGIDRQL